MKIIFTELFQNTLDNLINNLSKFPDINDGACAFAATTIYDEINKIKKQYDFLDDLKLSYSIICNYNADKDERIELLNGYKSFEENYKKFLKTQDYEYYDVCNELYDDINCCFDHVMLNISFDNKNFIIDGQNKNLQQYRNNFNLNDAFICYETNNHHFMKKLSLDLEWWMLKEFEDVENYMKNVKKEIQKTFKQLKKELDKEIFLHNVIDNKMEQALEKNKGFKI